MNGQDLLEKFPHVTEVIRQWYKGEMIKSAETVELDPDYKEDLLNYKVDDRMLKMVVESNPRVLFDAFDNNKVYIFIVPEFYPLSKTVTFNYQIHYNSVGLAKGTIECGTRREAEDLAIQQAFETLEVKLITKAEKT